MNIIIAFDGYLLLLVILIGIMGFFLDSSYFKSQNNMKAYKESKVVSSVLMIVTLVIFLIRVIFIV